MTRQWTKESRIRRKNNEKVCSRVHKTARGISYERRLLIEEFKREINRATRRKLMKKEAHGGRIIPRSVGQWYERVVNLDRH